MGDPFAVYREGEEWRRVALEKTWPGLHEVLAGLDAPKPAWGCAFHGHGEGPYRKYEPVVGRMWLNGPPACAEHLKASKREGGYPLERIDPREWKDD